MDEFVEGKLRSDSKIFPHTVFHEAFSNWILSEIFKSITCGWQAVPSMILSDFLAVIYKHRFCGVVVITSALHAEGREFEPRQNLQNFLLFLK